MHLPKSIPLLLSILTPLTTAQSRSSACPYNYPSQLNSTTGPSGFLLHVKSNNPLTRNRAVQLRPDGTSNANAIVVVDSTSPVLLSQLRNGVLYSENTTAENQLYDLGPIGGLLNVTTTATSSLQVLVVRKPAAYGSSPPGGFNARGGFQMFNLGDDGTYGLYHETPVGFSNGFVICEKQGGKYFQVFYYEYTQSPAEMPGCEFIGLQTTLAPQILNGKATFP